MLTVWKSSQEKNNLSWNPVYSFWRIETKLICRVSCNWVICLIEMSSQDRLFSYGARSDREKQRFFPFFVTCDKNLFTRQLVSKKRCDGLSYNNLVCGEQMLFSALVSPTESTGETTAKKSVCSPLACDNPDQLNKMMFLFSFFSFSNFQTSHREEVQQTLAQRKAERLKVRSKMA